MKFAAGRVELTLAGDEIDGVVGISPVRRAATREHESTVAKLAEVIRDETLRLVDEFRQLRHRSVAPDQLAQQSPANGVRGQSHEGGWRTGERRDGPGHGKDARRVSESNQTGLMYPFGPRRLSRCPGGSRPSSRPAAC